MRFTAMSCSRHASTVSSDSPFFCASFALCNIWFTVCGIKRSLKKSTIVGRGGMAASAPSGSGRPPGVRPPNRTPVPRRTPCAGAAWSSCLIMRSSRASARSSEDSAPAFELGPATKVLRSTSILTSSGYRATLSRAAARVNRSNSLWLDLRQFHVALPALRVALHERLHLFGRTRERVERRVREELLRVLGTGDLVEPAGELVHDGFGRARGDHDAPPGRDVGSAVAELGERRHVGKGRRALRRGRRENTQFPRFRLSQPPGGIEGNEVELPQEQIGQGLRVLLVRNIDRLHAGRGLEELCGDHAGVAGRTVEARPRFALEVRDQL